jgi:hypothetical protein
MIFSISSWMFRNGFGLFSLADFDRSEFPIEYGLCLLVHGVDRMGKGVRPPTPREEDQHHQPL